MTRTPILSASRPVASLTACLAAGALTAACSQPAAPPASGPAPDAPAGATPNADVAATAAAGAPSQTRRFRDWVAVCDNGNRCVAYSGSDGGPGWIQVRLAPGPDGRPAVTTGTVAYGSGPRPRPTLVVDGRAVPLDARAIDALARGHEAALTAGPDRTPVSLSGAAAAFLWIDERQGRLGTPGALIRRGDRPAGAVAPVPPLPRVPVRALPGRQTGAQRPVPAALAALPAVRECAGLGSGPGGETWDLGDGQWLWLIPCGAGAYNFSQKPFLTRADGSDPRPLLLPTSGDPVDYFVNGALDPATGRLDSFDKGRGIGDCGVARVWGWSGRAFVLLRETAMPDC